MRLRLFLGIFLMLFLVVAWFFISHAYVFMRLTSVLGFAVIVAGLLALVLVFLRRAG